MIERMKVEKKNARSVRQIGSQALPWDLLADIETHTDGYSEEKLQQAKNKHNSELKQDPARKEATSFYGFRKKKYR